jgi:hypothetical protein
LSRRLHDGALQSATAVHLRLQLLVQRLPDDDDAAAALAAAGGLIAELRSLEAELAE